MIIILNYLINLGQYFFLNMADKINQVDSLK